MSLKYIVCYDNRMSKEKRGRYWDKYTKQEKEVIFAYLAKKRWDKTSKVYRIKYSKMMHKAKRNKKLSTGKLD